MEKNICNVIWVDDDIENICPNVGLGGLKRQLKNANIEVIGKARYSYEFEQLMRDCYDRVDAVITDANFSDSSPTPATETDFKGFVKIIRVMDSYNQRKIIPFYLYTGKKRYLDAFQNGELDYFIQNGRFFEKGSDCEKMFNRIIEDVKHINSSSFRIQNKYKAELEAASLIDGNRESLFNALLYEYSDDWKSTEDYFNPMRKIVESIFAECKKLKIIPSIERLGEISRFLSNKHEKYKILDGEEIMPKPLTRSLWLFLDITQEGSHKKDDVPLGVEKYVRETKNINLFRAILYIAMDICLWFKSCVEETKLPGFFPKWEEIKYEVKDTISSKVQEKEKNTEIEVSNETKNAKSKYEGKIYIPEQDENGVWHCEECVVGITHWDSGKMLLKEVSNNTNTKTNSKYPLYAKYDKVE